MSVRLSRIERWRSCFYNFYMNGSFWKLMCTEMAGLLIDTLKKTKQNHSSLGQKFRETLKSKIENY